MKRAGQTAEKRIWQLISHDSCVCIAKSIAKCVPHLSFPRISIIGADCVCYPISIPMGDRIIALHRIAMNPSFCGGTIGSNIGKSEDDRRGAAFFFGLCGAGCRLNSDGLKLDRSQLA